MILNSFKKEMPLAIYTPNNKALSEFAQYFNIKKRESYGDLQDYITSIVMYFDKKAVMIREIARNKKTYSDNFINYIKRQIKTNEIPNECKIRIPNKSFMSTPNVNKLPIPLITTAKWNINVADKFHIYNNINSGMYNSIVKGLTNGKISKVANLNNIVLYDEVLIFCKTNDELLQNINKLVYPTNDLNFILNYIQGVKDLFNTYKSLPIEGDDKISYETKLMKAFIQMENLCTYYKYIINMLTTIYSAKVDSLFYIVSAKDPVLETTMITELFNDHGCLYESEAYTEQGLDIRSMVNNQKENKKIEQIYILNFLRDYITNVYNQTKKSIEMHKADDFQPCWVYTPYDFDKKDLEQFLSTVSTKLSKDEITQQIKQLSSYDYHRLRLKAYEIREDLILKYKTEMLEALYVEYSIIIKDLDYYISVYDTMEKEGNYNSYSYIFNREYKDIALFMNMEINTLEYEIQHHKDFYIIQKYDCYTSMFSSDPTSYSHHFNVLKILTDNNKYELYELVKKYFNTKCCARDMRDLLWNFETPNPDSYGLTKMPNLSDWLLMAILHFQRKCSLV